MIAALALLAAAAPLADDAQLSCAWIGTGDAAPTQVDIDFRGRRTPGAVLRFAAEGPYARVGSTSPPTRRADGSVTIAFATGNGRYRIELTPGDGATRLRLATLSDDGQRPTAAVGFCAARPGKRLPDARLVAAPADVATPPRPWRLQPVPGRLPDMACRLIAPDRREHDLQVRITQAKDNELSATYAFATSGLLGAAAAFGSGTQFFLVAPAERLIATTVQLAGPPPPIYVHTTHERSGNWIDITRDGRTLAVGACGQPLPAIVSPAPGVPR